MIIHLNHTLVRPEDARISPFDRGYLLGDGVYEGLRAFRRRIVGLDRHVARMRRALREARIDWDPGVLERLCDELLEANDLPDAFVYWQVTRGVPGPGQSVRTRVPTGPMTPTVLGFCYEQPALEAYVEPGTITAALVRDTRWSRGHLKSISLLGNVIASLECRDAGAQDAILYRDDLVAEGSATNVILSIPGEGLATPSLDSVSILAGVTRAILLDRVPGIVERPIRVEELDRASEIMLVGSTAMVTSVTRLDARPVGDGGPGPEAKRLLRALVRAIEDEHAPKVSSPWASSTAVA